MNYINVKAASEKWGITERRIQEMCKNGKISGATRFGKTWMIPEDLEKPHDGRTRGGKLHKEKVHGKFMIPPPRQNPFILHTDLYNTPGTASDVVDLFKDYPESRLIVEAQFDYRRGDIEKVEKNLDHFLKDHIGFNSTISAGILLGFCAMHKGDIDLWHKARRHIYEAPRREPNDKNIIDFWISVLDSKISNTEDFPEWFKMGNFDYLPFDTLCTARVYYVRYLFISAFELATGKRTLPYVEGLGLMRTLPFMIEPMISQAVKEKTLIPEIYLRLMAGVAYHNIGDEKKAIDHIDKAIELAMPDKLFCILAEYRLIIGSLLDDRLVLVGNDALQSVREIYKKMHAGTVALHNKVLERSFSDKLTVREREVARLAAFGLSNTEIAERLHLEISSVKQYIFSAMNKVGAEKRTELGYYI